MMRTLFIPARLGLSALALSGLFLTGCSGSNADPTFDDAALAAGIWDQVLKARQWQQPENWEGAQPASHWADDAHGLSVSLWLNDHAAGTLGGTIIDGGILVSFDLGPVSEIPTSISVMKKVPGYSPENGDWFWAIYDSDGTVQQAGAWHACIYCHLNGTDYVYSEWLSPESSYTIPVGEDTGVGEDSGSADTGSVDSGG